MENEWSPLFFLIFFIAVWQAATALISFTGGWYFLAKRFAGKKRDFEEVKTFHLQSMKLGLLTSYGSCLRVGIFTEGIEFRVLFLFAFLHKPIFIPWDDFRIRGYSEKIRKRMRCEAGGKKLVLYGRTVKFLRDEWPAKRDVND